MKSLGSLLFLQIIHIEIRQFVQAMNYWSENKMRRELELEGRTSADKEVEKLDGREQTRAVSAACEEMRISHKLCM